MTRTSKYSNIRIHFFPTNPSPTWVIDSISEVPPTDFISDAWLSDSFCFCFCCCIWLFETKTSTVSSCLARYSINCSFSSTISTTTNHHLYTRFCDSRPYHTQASLDPQFSPLPPLPFLPSLTPNFLFSISLTFSFPQNPARSPWNALWQDLKNYLKTFAKYIAYTRYIKLWKWLMFGADHVLDWERMTVKIWSFHRQGISWAAQVASSSESHCSDCGQWRLKIEIRRSLKRSY